LKKRPKGLFQHLIHKQAESIPVFSMPYPVCEVEVMSKGELTRQRIIAEAAPIFNRRGYEGCSMQEILDATGLEKGGIYRHFASKEELAVEAFRYALTNTVKIRTTNLDQVQGATEQLRYVVRRFAEGPSFLPGGCPLMNTAVDADDGNPVLRRLAREALQNWTAGLSRIVEEGIRRGEIRKSVEPRRIANTIIATLEGALMISRIEGSRQAMHDAHDSLKILIKDIEPMTPTKRVPQVSHLRPGIKKKPKARSKAKRL
jgi:AcrR family transcriptional regulator